MRVVVDPKRCVCSGVCMALAPKTFDVGPEQVTVAANPPREAKEILQRAAEECPTQAISLVSEPTEDEDARR